MKQSLPPRITGDVQTAARDWSQNGKTARLWKRDKTLWTDSDEDKWLGWLDIPDRQLEQKQRFEDVALQVKSGGYRNAVVLGMGGSSLCPEVLAITFGQRDDFPALHVLDSTDPAEVKAIETLADPKTSLYIVSSKSGSTLEPNIFKQYFFEKAGGKSGNAGSRFIAVTVAGFAVTQLLERAVQIAKRCFEPEAADNPGVSLGLTPGTLAKHGHDKITLIASQAIYDFRAWPEQLIAESTGKNGRALIPVDRESPGPPEVYGADRTFVYISFTPEIDAAQEDAVRKLENSGHPVIRIDIADRNDLGGEFFHWEIAIAVTGAVIGINPFDRPDVEASVGEKLHSTGCEDRRFRGKLACLLIAGNASKLKGTSAAEMLRSHLNRLTTGDYFALLGYIQVNAEHEQALRQMRLDVRDKKRVATCLGFGPRFLHSIGQAYKGGPNTGVFLQITGDDAHDLPIPGQKFTFGIVKAAQARGDFDVLAERKRRRPSRPSAGGFTTGLATLKAAITEALS